MTSKLEEAETELEMVKTVPVEVVRVLKRPVSASKVEDTDALPVMEVLPVVGAKVKLPTGEILRVESELRVVAFKVTASRVADTEALPVTCKAKGEAEKVVKPVKALADVPD